MNFNIRIKIFFGIIVIFLNLFCFNCFSSDKNINKEALFYNKLKNNKVQCELCPRKCILSLGERGFCGSRKNVDGKLISLTYGNLVSFNSWDPIEKKPLFHFMPGEKVFSIATAGCNLKCKFCQNWYISHGSPEKIDSTHMSPGELVSLVKKSNRKIIAYTYNEPTVFYEFMLETAKLAHKQGIKNVMHSSGYINEKPLRELAQYIDAANIDLKGFSDQFYAKICNGTLEPVLNSLRVLKEEGVHIEITNLVITLFNDDLEKIRQMCVWINDNLGQDTPLHFSRFFPCFKLDMLSPTPVETLIKARSIALDCGLKYVYIGNIDKSLSDNEDTYCPKCGKKLVDRSGYFVIENNIKDNKCKFCKEKIYGNW
ncbi:MAG: AmmeMemoRadiSam system radical SAM enzyme [Candidatus Gygaella obscura]|nr:AmmeMemoRadiSam system radical SAM enzyme [Candidatus Gygaella obscura]